MVTSPFGKSTEILRSPVLQRRRSCSDIRISLRTDDPEGLVSSVIENRLVRGQIMVEPTKPDEKKILVEDV